jgi:signal transduction histidine kinase/HPt (histidine-containing phosphotransfer) domain-containing protein/AmiR/NasT family two-component response regulator
MATPLQIFSREFGYVLLEHKGEGKFILRSNPPSWFNELWGATQSGEALISLAEKSPFLENFLVEAQTCWSSSQTAECRSEVWIESTAAGRDVPLQATALHRDGKQALVLHSPEVQYRGQVRILQTARNAVLENEKLLREIQKKEILLHCIIHDLSQPLSAMRGSFDCLSAESLSEEGQKFMALGKMATQQQESMIRQIVQVFAADLQATMDADKETNQAPDLLACARNAITSLSPAFAAKRVNLILDPQIDQHAPWHVQGEESRLRRVFTNLLENALRYSSEGGNVTVGLESDGEFRKAFVDDEGPGLPPDLRPAQMFALFSKGKDGGGKAGLGLYFCRTTVERWGGSISCTSLPEIGSRFWFRLPRAAAPVAGEAPPDEPLSAVADPRLVVKGRRRAMRILFADDQEDIRTLTSYQLERSGHHVHAVCNGREALSALLHEHFDVILLDEEMPAMGGVQAAHTIRENEARAGSHAFLIALTGNNSEEDKARLRREGFDAVLGKPFRLEGLTEILDSASSTLPLTSAPKKSPAAIPAGIDDLLGRIGGDKKLLNKMIQTFLRDTPKRIAALQKALQRKDADEIASLAHALKGSVSIFLAQHARDRAQELEDIGRKCELGGATTIYAALKEEIAKLEENLRGYAKQTQAQPRSTDSAKKQRLTGKRKKQ